jgi:chemotaxis protein MotB
MQGAQLTGPGQEMTLNAEQVKKVHEMMVQLLESENLMNEVTVRVEERGIVISIIDGLLFQSGSVELIPPARRLIYKIAQIINDLPNQISVEGHTDNVPLNRGPYRDNWGLSAMRAAVVGSYLVEAGIDPKRLRTVGYGQSRPLVPNDTEEHRRINRRVDIVILNNFKE